MANLRARKFFIIALVMAISLVVLACTPGIGNTSPPAATPNPPATIAPAPEAPAGVEKIQHFVFIMQENRSFDSYFGTYPGAEGIPPGISFVDPHDGSTVTPYHDSNDINRGGPHGWDNAQADIDNGKMNGFLQESYKGRNADGTSFNPANTPGRNPKDVMGWHDYREIPNYWSYARLYVLQDRMFESVASYSLPAGEETGRVRVRSRRPRDRSPVQPRESM
jgi:phospholipase C